MTRDKKDTAMVVSALAMLAFDALLTSGGFIMNPSEVERVTATDQG